MNTKKPLVRDKIAQVYMGKWGDEDSQKKTRSRINWLAEQVSHSTVLDIGCSEGILAILLGRKGIEVTGVDINPDSIQFAKELLLHEEPTTQQKVTFLCANIFHSEWANTKFDYVILGEIIEHFDEPAALIEKAVQLLKPGGVILVTTPFGYFPDPDHHSTFTLRSFINLFRAILTPRNIDIKDGYIRFAGINLLPPPEAWNVIDDATMELTEQGILSEQARYLAIIEQLKNRQTAAVDRLKQQHAAAVDLITQENRTLQIRNSELEQRKRQIETKYKELLARYEVTTNTLAFRVGQEISIAFHPPRLRSILLLPVKIGKLVWHWLKRKSIIQRQCIRLRGIFQQGSSTPSAFNQQRQEETFTTALSQFLQLAAAQPNKPVVILSTTTKRMGTQKRLNRPMAFAQELAKLQIPVIYVYYRWKASDDFDSDYDGSFLLQFPNDLFHKMSVNIANRVTNQRKLFLISIPDVHATSELELFRLNGWKVGYEVRDEWSEFNKAGVGNWYKTAFEIYLSSNADFVTTVSNRLHDKMIDFGAKKATTHIIPNGLSTHFLEMATPFFENRRSGYRGNGTIGYFGHLTEKWFNWDLLLAAAENRKDLEFEIIGFDAPKSLQLPKNVKLLGEKAHDEIIQIAKKWSLATIPFKNNELARAVDPIKLYEYLALGLPCVSCLMDQIKGYPFTFVYENDNDFIKTIERGLAFTPSDEEWDCVHNFVLENTWRSRVLKTLQVGEIKEYEN